MWPGSDRVHLIEGGHIADLTEVLNNDVEWKSRFRSDILDYAKQDDHVYSLPVEMIAEGLYINRDLFERYKNKGT